MKKRYVVTIDLYVYEEDDARANYTAEALTKIIDKNTDNESRPGVVSIHEVPFGKNKSIEIKTN